MSGEAKEAIRTAKVVLWLGLMALAVGFAAKAAWLLFRAGWGVL